MIVLRFCVTMSMFYMNPVKGEIPVHLLEVIVAKRLEYLKTILKGDNAVYNEYVIEGSLYDNVGHFALCTAAILSENIEFLTFVTRSEMELFRVRINLFSTYDLRRFAKKILKYIKKLSLRPPFVDSLEILCQHLVLKHMAQHLLTHDNYCLEHKLKVHFKRCLSFVARRQVELENGEAFIPCCKWKQYLFTIFEENLKYKLKKNIRHIGVDPRMKSIVNTLQKEFIPLLQNKISIISSKEVDKVSTYFPPCMLNLHQSLRQKHRLSHSQRFYYTLYLKGIGMPVQEAIQFWKEEYIQSPNGHHTCCHNWERDEKKFVYGIRHMYGLEGARKNYISINCQRMQNIDNCAEGGCPFKSFDDRNFWKLLRNPTQIQLSQINNLRNKKQYTQACMATLSDLEECDNYSFNFTPVKYYSISIKKK